MITKKELQDYANLRQLNLGQAEKDYIITLVLFLVSKYNYLVFKGGTALAKAYNLDRFSEDMDFTVTEDNLDINAAMSDTKKELEQFGIRSELKEVETVSNSKKYHLKAEGPLYIGTLTSKCKVVFDFSFREKLLLESNLKKINHQLNEIPLFEIRAMDLREIMAEKVRAVLTRNKARDLYDLMFLINIGVSATKDMLNRKLGYYNQKFSFKKFKAAVNSKKGIWESELRFLVKNVPDFNLTKRKVIEYLTKRL